MSNFAHWFDPLWLVQAAGLLGVWLIIFAESGLFFGFFFPGDSLLFTAGFLASQGHLELWLLIIGAVAAACLGDSVGYWFGAKVGPKIFSRADSFFFHQEHLERTRVFYARHGKPTIVLARFVPIVRTFAPILAGVGRMEYQVFLIYNLVGGAVWGGGLPLLGYLLGAIFPGVDRYLLVIVAAIVVLSLIPALRHLRYNGK
ncbi:MAG: VTT domain-containing protein [Candidatus Vogelbacteria bacterium]|nr:VTT domain-containing protein [Candidatus Vogelbacteria bacterium]